MIFIACLMWWILCCKSINKGFEDWIHRTIAHDIHRTINKGFEDCNSISLIYIKFMQSLIMFQESNHSLNQQWYWVTIHWSKKYWVAIAIQLNCDKLLYIIRNRNNSEKIYIHIYNWKFKNVFYSIFKN